jgi:ankyrin repeat protein
MKFTIHIVLITFVAFFSSCSQNKQLYKATVKGNISKVKKLIENDAKIDYNELFNTTPLLLAANIGNLEIVKYLVSKGADINYQKQGFKLKSYQNIGEGNFNVNIEKIPSGGHSPLTFALWGHGDFDQIIKYLLEQGARINFSYIETNAEPTLIISGITYGIEVGVTGTSFIKPTKEIVETPLTYAIRRYKYCLDKSAPLAAEKYRIIIQLLINKGADKNADNGNGDNAYELAIKYNVIEIIEILKE